MTSHRQHFANRQKSQVFTLVEIMVALGIFLLMMTFLFEFVISGQRLWSASERLTRTSEQGQVVLGIVSEDLRNMQYSTAKENGRPYYKKADMTNISITYPSSATAVSRTCDVYLFYALMTPAENDTYKVGIYPIAYVYDKADMKLYRKVIQPGTGTTPTIQWCFMDLKAYCQGNADTINLDTYMNNTMQSFLQYNLSIDSEADLLLDNVGGFSLSGADGFCSTELHSIDVNLSIFERDSVNLDDWESKKELGAAIEKQWIDYHSKFYHKSVAVQTIKNQLDTL